MSMTPQEMLTKLPKLPFTELEATFYAYKVLIQLVFGLDTPRRHQLLVHLQDFFELLLDEKDEQRKKERNGP